jgi:hypothetical protein
MLRIPQTSAPPPTGITLHQKTAALAASGMKWIAAQIGHTSPSFTFSVYQQVATRRYIDEEAIWTLMRFADEPAERARTRQTSRGARHDPRCPLTIAGGEFDRAVEALNDAEEKTDT